LETAGYVEVTKEFLDKKPHTALQLTQKGRTAFKEYSRKMKQVFEDLPK
jgi:DNA-binding PadR family transcriptional regulator